MSQSHYPKRGPEKRESQIPADAAHVPAPQISAARGGVDAGGRRICGDNSDREGLQNVPAAASEAMCMTQRGREGTVRAAT